MTLRGQVTAQAATAPQQPEEQAATVSPTAYRAPTFASPGFTDTTMMLGETKKSRRRLRVLVATLAAVFFVATLGTGFVALKQSKAAGQWRQHDQSEVALDHALLTRNDALSTELVLAHSTVASLHSQTSELNGQIKSLQVQLSSVTNAKAKLVNWSALLTQLTKEAGTVSNELSMCVGETNSLQTEIGKDLSNPSHKDPLLQSNTRTTSQVCATAQQGNRKLQSTLRGG
jgi:preprotein translocase subunit SecG